MDNGPEGEIVAVRYTVRGVVQGVGFRPFIYKLARAHGLTGWVRNDPAGVVIEVQGTLAQLESFERGIASDAPPAARVESIALEVVRRGVAREQAFRIVSSEHEGARTALLSPDLAVCPDCLRELFDPGDRRFRYPFINCTNCGPRYSIIESIPYDRPHTSMKSFTMCPACSREYGDPGDRRFHAQPNACPECGPEIALWNKEGQPMACRDDALRQAAEAVRQGKILALKGLGGFHLLADARNEDTVRLLRRRKSREEKPFALMFPEAAMLGAACEYGEAELQILQSVQSPIVLLRRRDGAAPEIAPSIAPGNPWLGAMLPYTPLHHLLLAELGFPVIATSGNLADEPICIDEREALTRLRGIADLFLVHNRPILRHVDDSIVKMIGGRPVVLRRARGFAPLPIHLDVESPAPILAVGAHLKNTIAVLNGREAYLSPHLGDLETPQSVAAFEQAIAGLSGIYDSRPEITVCDLHPEYYSTRYAEGRGGEVHHVQHHYAHVLSCLAENGAKPPVLGVSWDGTGYGTDGTIWGGEFLLLQERGFERYAHLLPFRLPGGDAAVREPRRTALSLLDECGYPLEDLPDWLPLSRAFRGDDLRAVAQLLRRNVHSPRTSSAGRLFDGVSALLGLCPFSRFEGQAAMDLEFVLPAKPDDGSYPYSLLETSGGPILADWRPAVRGILHDIKAGEAPGVISSRFHNTLIEIIVSLVLQSRIPTAALSGGCFQNGYLTAQTVSRLRSAGVCVYTHTQVPPNDNGIALGQLVGALRDRKTAGK